MKQLFKHNAVFLTLSLILLGVLGLALIYIPKGELHLLLSTPHTPARNIFYRYYTQIAEWLPYVICICILLFDCIGNGLMASSCLVFSALTTQLFKHLVNAPRPLTWFSANMQDVQLPLVEGVRMNYWFSFPSGHTTSFFALFFALSILSTNYLTAQRTKNANHSTGRQSNIMCVLLQVLFFVLAALGGYSRIYLNQHFAIDVFAGIGVGVSISIITYVLFCRWKDKKWYKYRIFAKK